MMFLSLLASAAMAASSVPTVTIVALGDSTTAGTPFFRSPVEAPPDGEGDRSAPWPSVLERMRPAWRILNKGVNGERADEIRARFERDVLAAKPRFVVILAGVNDVYQGRDLHDTEADLTWMYDRAVKSRIEPVAATVMPFTLATPEQSARIRELNAWIVKTASTRGLALCDLHAAVAAKDSPDALAGSPEGLHPDRAGYAAAAKAVAGVLDAQLSAAARPRSPSKSSQ
jgi:lysophospholipase L1-like esterase